MDSKSGNQPSRSHSPKKKTERLHKYPTPNSKCCPWPMLELSFGTTKQNPNPSTFLFLWTSKLFLSGFQPVPTSFTTGGYSRQYPKQSASRRRRKSGWACLHLISTQRTCRSASYQKYSGHPQVALLSTKIRHHKRI